MKQRENPNAKVSKTQKHLDNLDQQQENQSRDSTDMWGRAADSFLLNSCKPRFGRIVATVLGVIVCALVVHIFFSPERWIRF